MAFWSNWSDGTKWLMGILGALIVSVVIALASRFRADETPTVIEPTPTRVEPTPSVTPAPFPIPAPTPPESQQLGPAPIAASPREQIANDYRFVLKHCRPDGADLLCTIGVTNLRQTRKLTLKPRSRLISEDGVSYEVDKFVKDTGVAYNSGMTLDTPTDIELTFGLRFFGIAHKFTKAQLLQLICPGFDVQWRNVSFP